MLRLRGRVLAGRALTKRQCTLEGDTQFVNVRDSVHWKEVHRIGEWTLGVQSFFN